MLGSIIIEENPLTFNSVDELLSTLKESVNNVLSTLDTEGKNIVYMLLEDHDGVGRSFPYICIEEIVPGEPKPYKEVIKRDAKKKKETETAALKIAKDLSG
jgi:hypothetical protein